MDRGEAGPTEAIGGETSGFAANASARVGSILAEAERDSAAQREEAEREAAEIERAGREEADAVLAKALEAAREAAEGRAEELRKLRAALAERGPALVEGLDGAGMTRARLESLMEALDAAAEQVLVEAEREAEPASPDEAEPASPDEPEPVDAPDETAEASAPASNGDSSGGGVPYDGPLPEGAPMARKPKARSSDVRFAAVLLAVQGREREEVEKHLRSEYGAGDCDPILDEVFGRTPA